MTRTNTSRCRGRVRSSTSGFTLVEILIALVIVVLLIALLVPALTGGLRAGKRAQVKAEISSLAQALADFKVKYGDYPPSRMYLCESGNFPISTSTTAGGATVAATLTPSDSTVTDIAMGQLIQRSVSAMRKFFPRVLIHTDGTDVFASGSTTWYDFNGNGTFDSGYYILQGHECLTFFLGGIPLNSETGYGMTGLGTNPANPFTNSVTSSTMYGANRSTPFYEFNGSRLVLDPNNPTNPGIPGYYDSLGNATPDSSAPSGLNFFAYFSTTGIGGGYDPNDVNFDSTESDGYLGYLFQGGSVISPGPNPYTSSTTNPISGTISYINPQSFQIISAGLDGLYGVAGQYTPPPAAAALPVDPTHTTIHTTNSNPNVESATVGTIRNRERDNITNFGATSQLD